MIGSVSDVQSSVGVSIEANAPGSTNRVEVDPHVLPGVSASGNRYARAFKLRVLQEADACTQPGDIGRLLRRNGITHTTLTSFRRQRAAGALAPTPSRGSAESGGASGKQARRVLELERENRTLRRRLDQAEAIIEVQKKVSRLLEVSLGNPERRGDD